MRLQATLEGLPVTTTSLVEVGGTTYEVKTTKGIEWLLQPWGEMNIKVQESGDFQFAITGGPDADRFVINEIGSISFKDSAPASKSGGPGNPGNPPSTGMDANEPYNPNNIDFDDSDKDGTYLITVSVTQGDFTQEYDIELEFPEWYETPRTLAGTFSELDSSQFVIEINEHSSTLRNFQKGVYVETEDDDSDVTPPPDQTFVVTVIGGPGTWRYVIDGVETASLDLYAGATYTFDLSDSSNATHPFRFSETLDGTWGGGTVYSTNVEVNGTPGSAGAYVSITVDSTTPDLYYFCQAHANQGGSGLLSTLDAAPQFINTDGLALGDLNSTITDTINGVDGSINSSNVTNGPLPPSLGSTDWVKVETLFGIDPSIGQAIVQPILARQFGVDPYAPLSDLIGVLNAVFGAGIVIEDPKTSDPTIEGETTFYSYYNVLNFENLSSVFADTQAGKSPVLTYAFDSIPAAGTSGSFILTANLNNGRDTYKADFVNNAGFWKESTEELTSSINVNWTSDGSTITFEIPDQALTVTRTTKSGETSTATWDNIKKTVISSNATNDEDGNAIVELSLEIGSLFNGQGENTGSSLADFIQNNGHYTLKVDLEGAEFQNVVRSDSMDSFTVLFDTASNKTTFSAQTESVNEKEGFATIVVNLSHPLEEDFTLQYVTLDGDQFAYYQSAQEGRDYFDASGEVIIPAGQTQATITVTVLQDYDNEGTESLTVQFPQFQSQTEDGWNITTSNDVSLNNSTNGVLVLIENQAVISENYYGLELNITNAPSRDEGYVHLRNFDEQGNPIKDNDNFRVAVSYTHLRAHET